MSLISHRLLAVINQMSLTIFATHWRASRNMFRARFRISTWGPGTLGVNNAAHSNWRIKMPRWLYAISIAGMAVPGCGGSQSPAGPTDPNRPGTIHVLPSAVTSTGGVDITANASNAAASRTQVLWQVDDGTETNRFAIYMDTDGTLHFSVISGGILRSDRSLGKVTGASLAASFRWNGTTTQYRLGTLVFNEYGVTLPAGMTNERIGTDSIGDMWNGTISNVQMYSTEQFTPPLFGDSFNRANTNPGSLGVAPNNKPYAMYGAYVSSFPLPPATQGQVMSKAFVSAPPSVVYATMNLGVSIHHISAVISWDNSGAHSLSETAALIISPSSNLIDTMIHIPLSTDQLLVQKRVSGGPFVTLGTLNYNILDGLSHSVSVDATGSTVVVSLDGASVSVTDADFPALIGPFVVWEHYSTVQDVYPLSFLSVAASE